LIFVNFPIRHDANLTPVHRDSGMVKFWIFAGIVVLGLATVTESEVESASASAAPEEDRVVDGSPVTDPLAGPNQARRKIVDPAIEHHVEDERDPLVDPHVERAPGQNPDRTIDPPPERDPLQSPGTGTKPGPERVR